MVLPQIPLWRNEEVFKAVLTFDNGSTYEARSDNDQNDMLVALHVNESSAITSGNPLGIISPNSCNLEIWNLDNTLIPTNTSSPYNGYMRNGVKVNLFMLPDGSSVWEPYGEYYTEGWSTTKSNGSFEAASITCTDKLSYIGNKDIPKLSAYAGVNVVDLLREIFLAIGLTADEFSIDPSLSLDLVYAITKGDKLREVLNTIAQSLIARVTLDRSGVIQIIPAFPNYATLGVLRHSDVEKIAISHNQLSVYNKVKLSYNKVDNRPSEVLLSLNNLKISPGLNTFNNLQVSQNILSLDGVYLETEASELSSLDKVTAPNYKASQGGIDIDVYSNMLEDFYCTLTVEGRATGLTDAYVESVVKSTDVKVANTLSIESYVIQDEVSAQAYVNNVANYLYSMEQQISIAGTLSPSIYTGCYIEIQAGDATIDGKYLVNDFNLVVGESYSTSLKLIKIRSV